MTETKHKVGFTPHAVERYKERLNKEHLSNKQARDEITALMEYAEEGKPEWLKEARTNEYGRCHTYLSVDSLAFPARRTGTGALILISYITKGSMSPQRRMGKNKHNRVKRSRRGAGLRRAQGR